MEKTTLSYSIIPAWVVIDSMERKIKELFKYEDEELVNATLMTISELIENAVKYEKSTEASESIDIRFTADEKEVVITVSNPVPDIENLKVLEEHIKNITLSRDYKQLYTEKVRHLLENRQSGKSQLGLYRIAYEGRFYISYAYENTILTIIARRELQVK